MKKIPLTQGKFALVSDEDFDRVNQFKWCASNESKNRLKWYAVRMEKGQRIRMHRFIMGIPTGKEDTRVVHHKDNDGLNNTRENLEILDTNHHNMLEAPNWRRSSSVELPEF